LAASRACTFPVPRRIAADHAGSPAPHAKPLEQRQGKALQLVGDNPPPRRPVLEGAKELRHARKEASLPARVVGIDCEELLAQGIVSGTSGWMLKPAPSRPRAPCDAKGCVAATGRVAGRERCGRG